MAKRKVHRSVLLVAALAAPVLLGACGGSEAATTTTRLDGAASAKAAGGDGCDLIERLLLPPADLSDGSTDQISDADLAVKLRELADLVPADQRDAWIQLADTVQQEVDHPGSVSDDQREEGGDLIVASLPWAAKTCPDAPPAYACGNQRRFQTVGRAIDDEGDEPATTSPEQVLATFDGSDDAVVLDQDDDSVLYGWLDEDGLVTRSEEVGEQDGTWSAVMSLDCSTTSFGGTPEEEEFVPVGEAIPDN